MFRRVLVLVDFSAASLQAVHHACDLTRAVGSTLTLLHVLENPKERNRAHEYLQRLAQQSRRQAYIMVEPSHGHSVAQVILEVAHRIGSEVLILGPHSQELTHRRLGHVAAGVLLDAAIPVYLVPSGFKKSIPPSARWTSLVPKQTS